MGIRGIGALQGTPFALAGLGNSFPLPSVSNSTLFAHWVHRYQFTCSLFPLLGKLRTIWVNVSTGWQCDIAWVVATLRVVVVMHSVLGCSSWLALLASQAPPLLSSVDEFNCNFVAHCFIM